MPMLLPWEQLYVDFLISFHNVLVKILLKIFLKITEQLLWTFVTTNQTRSSFWNFKPSQSPWSGRSDPDVHDLLIDFDDFAKNRFSSRSRREIHRFVNGIMRVSVCACKRSTNKQAPLLRQRDSVLRTCLLLSMAVTCYRGLTRPRAFILVHAIVPGLMPDAVLRAL